MNLLFFFSLTFQTFCLTHFNLYLKYVNDLFPGNGNQSRSHISELKNDFVYFCIFCRMGFASSGYLINHLKCCARKKSYETYYKKNIYNKNFLAATIEIEEDFAQKYLGKENICIICETKFRSYNDLVQHLKLNESESFMCCKCLQMYPSKFDVDYHHYPITVSQPQEDFNKIVHCDLHYIENDDHDKMIQRNRLPLVKVSFNLS